MNTDVYAVQLNGINKSFGKTRALIEIDLRLAAAHRHALVGPNGSGKTTLLRLLAGLLPPESGTARCLGFDVRVDSRALKSHVAYVTQHFSMYEELTLQQNLQFNADLHAIPCESFAMDQVFDVFDLAANRNKRAGSVSMGVRQRLMLAAALTRHPKILLLDEPTAALDEQSRIMLWSHIDACQATGATIILTTHNPSDVERCDTVTDLAGGRIAAHRSVNHP